METLRSNTADINRHSHTCWTDILPGLVPRSWLGNRMDNTTFISNILATWIQPWLQIHCLPSHSNQINTVSNKHLAEQRLVSGGGGDAVPACIHVSLAPLFQRHLALTWRAINDPGSMISPGEIKRAPGQRAAGRCWSWEKRPTTATLTQLSPPYHGEQPGSWDSWFATVWGEVDGWMFSQSKGESKTSSQLLFAAVPPYLSGFVIDRSRRELWMMSSDGEKVRRECSVIIQRICVGNNHWLCVHPSISSASPPARQPMLEHRATMRQNVSVY